MSFAPPLDGSLHKGQSGRVAVVGGSIEYTGAPYFAAIASLKSGSDMAYIICAPEAAIPIKSYSPDIIVLPYLTGNPQQVVEKVDGLMQRLDVIVVGPGLGRDPGMLDMAALIIKRARCLGLYIDALICVERDLALVEGYSRVVLTPNLNEFKRLQNCMGIIDLDCQAISAALSIAIIQKGKEDIIAYKGVCHETQTSNRNPRRCGGQGDLLAGILATFLAWANGVEKQRWDPHRSINGPLMYQCCISACNVLRKCSWQAFLKANRGLSTSDIADLIPETLHLFLIETVGSICIN